MHVLRYVSVQNKKGNTVSSYHSKELASTKHERAGVLI